MTDESYYQKIGQFLVGVGAIAAFFVLLQLLKNQHPVLRFIEAEEIDSGSLFYTESEEAGTVEFDNQN